MKNRNVFGILRSIFGLTQREMAEKCGVSAVYWSELESGKKVNPSNDIIRRISRGCGIQPETIEFFFTQMGDKTLIPSCERWLLNSLDKYVRWNHGKVE